MDNLMQLAKIVENEAPRAWMLLRNEYIAAVQVKMWLAFGCALILALVSIVSYLIGKRMNEHYPQSGVGDALYLHSALSGIGFIVLAVIGFALCARLISPNLSLIECLVDALVR